ncbi:hypothetical protein OHA61_00360 [Streptomyces sp. NBC_00885]|uniref:hypothetical protein n=1 Tax=Streptomyces sp. NBC_00885 TaxID=2975857 RepID=UPI00386C6AA8|nr:hypothetical protein OHA61_00360 [Streptomyces sp. NBC_00885]
MTFLDVAAAGVLMMCLTGENHSTIASAVTDHHRPDGGAGGQATALVDWLKPRRGPASSHRTVPLQQGAGCREGARWDLHTPFGLYMLLIDLGAASRVWARTDALLVYFSLKGPHGSGFRTGMPSSMVHTWSKSMSLTSSNEVAGEGLLHVDSRRLRLTWLETNQRPVAHSERTLANDYLARNRGNLTDYQRVVAEVLEQQVAKARALPALPALAVMTEADLAEAREDPGRVAGRFGLSAGTFKEVLAGRLDTALAACTGHRASPHAPPGEPCPASFLLCLSCPCARATPEHLPVLALTLEKIDARRAAMPPSQWARRYGIPASQLTDILKQFPPQHVASARARCAEREHELVERLLNRGLDR